MSVITNCVLHLSNSQSVTKTMIELKNFPHGVKDYEQFFKWVPVNSFESELSYDLAGGTQTFTDDVFLLAGSYLEPSDVADWFMDLPWGQHDEAVLFISGNDRGYVCIRGENGRAERTEWFT